MALPKILNDWIEKFKRPAPPGANNNKPRKGLLWSLGGIILAIVLAYSILGWYWSIEPDIFDVSEVAMEKALVSSPDKLVTGYTYAATLSHIAETLLYKPGGYITNDIAPPGVLMDNIKNWEFGALVMLRDASTALRNHFARSQSQSREDPDLAKAEPYFYYESKSWALPSTEAEYEKGIDSLQHYMQRLANRNPNTNFYARADNLRQYIEIVEKRLGDLSHRLSASTEQSPDPSSGKPTARTPWIYVDDIFYEARGSSWALLHIFKAIEHDFRPILTSKHALDTTRNIIQELENAQIPLLSPVVLNGNGFGIFANYSLTMANYIARANAAALDLRDIMMRG